MPLRHRRAVGRAPGRRPADAGASGRPAAGWMLNTGTMLVVDLNADLAEGDVLTPGDLACPGRVTSASLACGFHAGGPDVMRATAAACVARGVAIGAHVSYRDREGFGRRAAGGRPRPVGRRHRGAVGGARRRGRGRSGVPSPSSSPTVRSTTRWGSTPRWRPPWSMRWPRREPGAGRPRPGRWSTAWRASRPPGGARGVPATAAYLPDGRLVPRDRAGALVEDPASTGRRAVSLARDGGVEARGRDVDGGRGRRPCASTATPPGAAATARAVRDALEPPVSQCGPSSWPAPGPDEPGDSVSDRPDRATTVDPLRGPGPAGGGGRRRRRPRSARPVEAERLAGRRPPASASRWSASAAWWSTCDDRDGVTDDGGVARRSVRDGAAHRPDRTAGRGRTRR